jgi:hypothetical protein
MKLIFIYYTVHFSGCRWKEMAKRKDQVVTSLRVDPELWKEAKIEAIRRGTTLASLIDKAMRKELKENRADAASDKDSSPVHKA